MIFPSLSASADTGKQQATGETDAPVVEFISEDIDEKAAVEQLTNGGKTQLPGEFILTSVYRDTEMILPAAAAGLEVGERVSILNADGSETTYYSPALSCTESITAHSVWKSHDYGHGKTTLYRSSGCSGDELGLARLQWENCGFWGCTWKYAVSWAGWVSPGDTRVVVMHKACVGTSSDKWRSGGSWSALYYTNGPAGYLNCNL